MDREEEMRSCIEDWMAEAYSIEQLAKAYSAIINEADLQLINMAEQISNEIKQSQDIKKN